ncbi:MAG TPA: RNA polymerase-binding protein RbpA [Jiangellaceae bacterium]|nr:RNA polymerase-binding protein RbpA [Jiangellaceae bacterium]
MAGANAIRGSRVGAGPMGEAERGEAAPRVRVSFYCGAGHVSDPRFAADADIPEEWECAQCGLPASQDEDKPPAAPSSQPYKTHLAYVKERRSDAEGAVLLDDALAALRAQRGG